MDTQTVTLISAAIATAHGTCSQNTPAALSTCVSSTT